MKRSATTPPRRLITGLLLASAVAGCRVAPTPPRQQPIDDVQTSWIGGAADARFNTLADQLRGLDVAMWEIGYRYAELHWALEDDNWEYARYQAEKIRTTLDLALQRRPARAAATDSIFLPVLEPFSTALDDRDAARSRAGFQQLTDACNRCHVAEAMPTVFITPPSTRSGVVRRRAP
jgi:hypothetical protein